MKKIFFLVIIFFQTLTASEAFFVPPNNWQLVNPKTYTKFIKVAFCENNKNLFRSTINLAEEKTSLSLDEYVIQAKKNHNENPNMTYRILSDLQLQQGIAKVCQINKKINSQDYEMLQLIFIHDGFAYVMTAASKKSTFLNNYQKFMKCFSSLQITDNLFSLVSDESLQKELQQKCDVTKQKKLLQKKTFNLLKNI